MKHPMKYRKPEAPKALCLHLGADLYRVVLDDGREMNVRAASKSEAVAEAKDRAPVSSIY